MGKLTSMLHIWGIAEQNTYFNSKDTNLLNDVCIAAMPHFSCCVIFALLLWYCLEFDFCHCGHRNNSITDEINSHCYVINRYIHIEMWLSSHPCN